MIKSFCILFFVFSFWSFSANAQKDVIKLSSCENQGIRLKADSIKKLLKEGGFVVMQEAMVNMESEYELPIIVPLQEGTWYQIVFIGDIRSKIYEVRMYDYDEKQVVYKKNLWGDVDGNVINFSYIPKSSEFYMIKPLQVNKAQKKNLCGFIMLMRKQIPVGNNK